MFKRIFRATLGLAFLVSMMAIHPALYIGFVLPVAIWVCI